MRISDWFRRVLFRSHAQVRALWPLCPARRGQGGRALQPAQGCSGGRPRPPDGAEAAVLAARDRRASRNGQADHRPHRPLWALSREIGRASCRERVCPYVVISVVAVTLTKNTHYETCYTIYYIQSQQ